ncbi:hypothetical protein [Brucella gallinifaecis]|uniref:hypothetical protein n=1 Tax=Brucella gallinifaecis TaxID=215590 RepID=UPI002362FC4D|nr:hypothetical protein [Brucella gallinifaecis]
MIRFLIKSAIWLSLAFMIMPHFFPADEENAHAPKQLDSTSNANPNSVDEMFSNGKTALELGKFCVNNPSLCENGASFLSSTASRAMERSGNVLDYLSDRFGKKPPNAAPATAQSTVKQEAASQPNHSFISKIPIPTPRAEGLRARDGLVTGAIPAQN